MSKRCRNSRRLLLALAVSGALAGCSDIYWDHRDSVALSSGDAVAANRVVHMVDPWPRASADRNIAFNGQRMQGAAERYRTNQVTAPVNATTSSTSYQQVQPVVLTTPASKP
ncbi:MAG TPA: hypothetical protein VH436_35180 [Vicinamibacterales bacterium]|jgi:hypothetical protein